MAKYKRKQIYYKTSEAAEICMCSQQTIIRCFDRGLIKGFYVPGSTHRRIPPSNLFRYMEENKIPMDNFPKNDMPKSSLEYLAKTKK